MNVQATSRMPVVVNSSLLGHNVSASGATQRPNATQLPNRRSVPRYRCYDRVCLSTRCSTSSAAAWASASLRLSCNAFFCRIRL